MRCVHSQVSGPLADECSTCEPGAEAKAKASLSEHARQMDGGERSQVKQQQVEQEEEEEEDGVWPTDDDDDDDKGEFYDGSDASQPERSDALFCTRQAACLDEEVRRSRALPYHRSFRSSKPRPTDMGRWKQRIFVARSFRLRKPHTANARTHDLFRTNPTCSLSQTLLAQ